MSLYRFRTVTILLLTLVLTLVASSSGRLFAGAEPDPALGGYQLLDRISHKPRALVAFLQTGLLEADLDAACRRLPDVLKEAGFLMAETAAPATLRFGTNMVPLTGNRFWHHLESERGRLWIDVVGFREADQVIRLFQSGKQGLHYNGRDNGRDHFQFLSRSGSEKPDTAVIMVRRDAVLLSFGAQLNSPFKWRESGENTPEECRQIAASIENVIGMAHAVAKGLVRAGTVTWVPPLSPSPDDERRMRIAAFARLWSGVKQNFVFLDKRPNLDWEHVLELYLPRMEAAQSNEEAIDILQECVALLQDGHSMVLTNTLDGPQILVRPIGGKPVIAALGQALESAASPIKPGMEILSIDGVPADQFLSQRILPKISASTAQNRLWQACEQLLDGPSQSKVRLSLKGADGRELEAEVVRDRQAGGSAPPWLQPPVVQVKELPGSLVLVTLNSFDSSEAVTEFDRHFDEILAAKGLIIDIRNNRGGNSGFALDIIARLVDRKIETLKWRSRMSIPALQAWGQPEGWHEGDFGLIEPRGDKRYRGPVVVLIGAGTFSAAEDFLQPLKSTKRATLIGEPTAGSTGNPILLDLGLTRAIICTKWDRFPDGTEFVGIGVQPDILVAPSRMDLAEGKDPVLAKALEFLNGQTQ